MTKQLRPKIYSGSCHCGNVAVSFCTKLGLDQIRACSCHFCKKHGARTTSDPNGRLQLVIKNQDLISRYSFNLHAAEYMICKNCGIYIAACGLYNGKIYSTLNVNVLESPDVFDIDPIIVNYENETLEERVARRLVKWTPTTITSVDPEE